MGLYKGCIASVVMGEKPVDFFILKSTKTLKNFGNCLSVDKAYKTLELNLQQHGCCKTSNGVSFFIQEAYPVKLKEVHVVNISPLVDTILSIVKPFLKEKIRNRVTSC
jgi:hypothetical protein